LKFAFVTTNLRGGGAEKAMLNLASLLASRGHQAQIWLLENRVEHAIPSGVAVRRLHHPGHSLRKGWLGKRLAAWRLKRQLTAAGPFDLIVSTLPFADEVVSLARLPKVWFRIANTLSAEIDSIAARDQKKAARRRQRYRHLYNRQQLIAVSDGVAADLKETLGLSDARIARIYNPFDFAHIRQQAKQPDPDLPHEAYVIHVGRFMPQKRHDVLLAAWREAALPHRLVLLTSPSPQLDQMIHAHGLTQQVTVAGFRPNPYPWIAGAELLVLASDREGMPNVLVEGLLCGTRAVSTDCPSGPREVLTGPLARWLVPCGDPHALASAMRDALASPRPSMPEDFAKFSAEKVAQAYEALALENRGNG
jgi:glycosyltransferase involved in cell wall biosynthesis